MTSTEVGINDETTYYVDTPSNDTCENQIRYIHIFLKLITLLGALRKSEKNIKYLCMYTQLLLRSVDKGRVPRKSRV